LSASVSLNDLRDHPTDAAQKVADKAKGVVETARGAASSIADKVRSVEVGGTVRKAADQMREHANDAAEQMSEHGETVVRQTAQHVREEPLGFALLGLIAFALGYILARRAVTVACRLWVSAASPPRGFLAPI
jgi:ElaB/YqjD/DUF883 family membrane-anchored ribosome-binding protein